MHPHVVSLKKQLGILPLVFDSCRQEAEVFLCNLVKKKAMMKTMTVYSLDKVQNLNEIADLK